MIFLADIHESTYNIDKLSKDKDTYLIIGNESGFSKKDLDFFEKTLKAKKIKLNTNVLRAETASIAGVAIIAHLLEAYKQVL